MRMTILAILAVLVCCAHAQETLKSAIKVDVDSFSTQEIEEQLQVTYIHIKNPNRRPFTK